jgi:hypothetical protein
MSAKDLLVAACLRHEDLAMGRKPVTPTPIRETITRQLWAFQDFGSNDGL